MQKPELRRAWGGVLGDGLGWFWVVGWGGSGCWGGWSTSLPSSGAVKQPTQAKTSCLFWEFIFRCDEGITSIWRCFLVFLVTEEESTVFADGYELFHSVPSVLGLDKWH